MIPEISKHDLVPILALWFDTKGQRIVVECENGFIYAGNGVYNFQALGYTDYSFQEVEIKDRHHIPDNAH